MSLPRWVGPWEVLAELGRGGCGLVVRARHADGRVAALKLLLEPLDREARVRLAREGRLLAGLAHPGVVRLLDQGETAQGQPWLAMELLPGGTLAERVARGGPLPLAEVVPLGMALAGALAALHAAGIVHRDLKPENVLFDAAGAPRLSDLGLSRATSPGATRMTATGALLGTPGSMSPEQARGEEAGPSSDVWALGVTLWFALAGQLPFSASSALGTLEQVLRAPARPPSALRPGVPPALDRLVLRCLEKDPAARPPAAELAAALAGLLAAAPAGRARRRALVAALAAAGAGALLGAALARGPGPVPPGPPVTPGAGGPAAVSTAAPPVDEARLEAARAHERGLTLAKGGDHQAALLLYERALALDPDRMEAWLHRGISRFALGDPRGACADLDRAVELDPRDRRARFMRAQAREQLDDLPGAVADFTCVLELTPDDPSPLLRRGAARHRLGELRGAIADLTRAIELGEGRAYLARGMTRMLLGEGQAALEDLDRAVEVAPGQALPLGTRGAALFQLGQEEAALVDLRRALALEPDSQDPWAREARRVLAELGE